MLLLWPIVHFVVLPGGVDWQGALLAGGGMFAIGFVIFVLRWMGGGDVKLMAVLALWTGYPLVLDFAFLIGVLGGVLSLALLFARPLIAFYFVQEKLPRVFKKGEAIPYGLAIAGAFLIVLWGGDVPGLGLQMR